MGFYFDKAAKAKAKAGAKRVAAGGPLGSVGPKTKQASETLARLGCKACPLAKAGPEVLEDFGRRTDVFFLGEAPGLTEVREGVPFVGKPGKLLRSMIPSELEDRCGYGNTVRHVPKDPDGNVRQPEWVEMESCRGYVTAAIEKAAPRLIVGLGIPPLKWVLNTADMVGMRGRFFAVKIGQHECWFMPTYDPEFIIKIAKDERRPLNGRMGGCFQKDMDLVWEALERDIEPPTILTPAGVKKGIVCYQGQRAKPEVDELLADLEKVLDTDGYAIDLETWPLRPYRDDSKILTCAISYWLDDGKQYTFSFPIDHPKAEWTKDERKQILKALKKVVAARHLKKIAHNVPFETEWFIHYFGIDIVDHDGWEDTIVQSYLIDARKGVAHSEKDENASQYQRLGFLTKMHYGLDIKTVFKVDRKDMRKSPLAETLIYNGADSKVTLRLLDDQNAILKRMGLRSVYKMAKPRQTAVAIMQHLGVPVDQKTLKKIENKLSTEIATIKTEVMDMKVVKQYVADHKVPINLDSTPQLLEIFKDYLKRPEVKVLVKGTKDQYRYSIDKAVLEKIPHPLAGKIITYRNRVKMKSTYVDGHILPTGQIVFPDGLLHTSFNTTYTTTSRLSSDEPNMQNFPKHRDGWIREQVEAPDGWVILSVDYGQLEWCTACMYCKDKAMVEATWKGEAYDVHREWALKIAKLWPHLLQFFRDKGEDADKALKSARSLVKNKMVFPVLYGAAEMSVAGYFLPAIGEAMPDDVTAKIFGEFWETFPMLKEWRDDYTSSYYKTGYGETLTGRRRYYPMTQAELLNSPIQSLAADIVNDAMDRVSKHAIKIDDMRMHPRMQIHDDLTFIMPDKDAYLADAISYLTRETLALPYDFINVPMSVEFSIAKKWNKLEPVGKFWSENYRSFESQGI